MRFVIDKSSIKDIIKCWESSIVVSSRDMRRIDIIHDLSLTELLSYNDKNHLIIFPNSIICEFSYYIPDFCLT